MPEPAALALPLPLPLLDSRTGGLGEAREEGTGTGRAPVGGGMGVAARPRAAGDALSRAPKGFAAGGEEAVAREEDSGVLNPLRGALYPGGKPVLGGAARCGSKLRGSSKKLRAGARSPSTTRDAPGLSAPNVGRRPLRFSTAPSRAGRRSTGRAP